MWEEGTITIYGEHKYLYSAKVFVLPSEFGINGGRISKLAICKDDGSGEWNNNNVVYNYDRGLDLTPIDDNAALALDSVLKIYPDPDKCEACNGTGKTEDENTCQVCNGDGYIDIDTDYMYG